MASFHAAIAAAFLLCSLFLHHVTALDNGLARLPVRGVSSWCAEGLCAWDRCWDSEFRSLADAMVTSGLKDAGYEFLHIDDCWVAGRDNRTNTLFPDPTRFPHGMKDLADYIHSKGLKAGIYSSFGTHPCTHGQYPREHEDVPGSYGHTTQDAQTFADWGYDYVKIDACFTNKPDGTPINATAAYIAWSKALNATGRPIYYLVRGYHNTNSSNIPDEWDGLHPYVNAYRLFGDHHDNFAQLESEIEANALASLHSEPGSWGDWDFIITGGQGCNSTKGHSTPGLRCPGMTSAEYYTEFSIWVVAASPLMVDADIRNMSALQRDILLHDEMLAIHHDAAARGGSRIGAAVSRGCPPGYCQVWSKPLAGNASAVLLYNRDDVARTLTLPFSLLGYGAGATGAEAGEQPPRLHLRDVWARQDLGVFHSTWTTTSPVPPHGVVVLRVEKR